VSLEITLQNAISGLQTTKQALQVISNNISNVNTEGYTRKITQQQERVVDGAGYGVEIANISRNVDEGVLRQLRTANGQNAQLSTADEFLKQVNTLFGKPEDNDSIAHRIADLGSQFDALAVTPETEATQFLTTKAASDVVDQFQQMSSELQRLRSEANTKITGAVTTFNSAMDSIVKLNAAIISFRASKVPTGELEDQRDQALNTMSNIMDIKYFPKGDGSITVFTGGGKTIVDGLSAQHLSYTPPSVMSPTLEYTPTDAVNYLAPTQTGYPVGGVPGIFVGSNQLAADDITSDISTGQIKGLVDLRDTSLPSVQAQIDELAEKFKETINTVHNQGAGYPPVAAMTGDRFVASGTSLNASGLVRIGIVDQNGNLQEEKTFDLSDFTAIGTNGATATDLLNSTSGLNSMTNMTASLDANGHLVLSATNNNRIAINELTSSVDAAGDLDKGFSDFFGLNNFLSSTENFTRYRSDLDSSATASTVTTAGTLQFSGSGYATSVAYSAGASLTSVKNAINANATLQAQGVTAAVVADGDGFRLQITDDGGQEFAMVETGGGSLLDDTNLRPDTRAISQRLSVRSDLVDSPFFMSRGALQSNVFQSNTPTADADPTATLDTYGVGTGTLTFTIDKNTSTTINYDGTTDTLNSLVTAINSNSVLQTANITAQVVVSGSTYSLKISDGEGDNYWIDDTASSGNSMGVDTDQGVTVGDSSVAQDLAAAFNQDVTFLAAPGRGGGLAQTTTNFSDYAANILSSQSALTSATETSLNSNTNLKNELFDKNNSISGVNMDEEMSNLIVYEQAYMAAARMISTTNELFKALQDIV
jgi:flagellar hook-associated protein 1 FlgK